MQSTILLTGDIYVAQEPRNFRPNPTVLIASFFAFGRKLERKGLQFQLGFVNFSNCASRNENHTGDSMERRAKNAKQKLNKANRFSASKRRWNRVIDHLGERNARSGFYCLSRSLRVHPHLGAGKRGQRAQMGMFSKIPFDGWSN